MANEQPTLVDRLRYYFGRDTGELCEEAADTIEALLGALEEAYAFISAPQRMETPRGGPKTATYHVANYNALAANLRAAIAKAKGQRP